MTERSGILIIAAGGLGDAVLFSHVFPRFAALAEDGEPVTLLLRSDAAKMGFLFPDAEIKAIDFKRLGKSYLYRRKMCAGLRRAKYRLVVSADYLRHPKLDEALVKAAAAEEALAMAPRSWSKYDSLLAKNRALYTRLFDSGEDHVDKVLRWSRFADWLTGESAPPPILRFDDNRVQGSQIVLVPFSAVAEKQSPADLYQKIIDILPGGSPVVIAGAPGELENNPGFETLLDHANVSYDDSDFERLAPTLASARLVISVDTATMHLAISLGAPTLCLASAAYVGEIVPYADEITPDNAHFIYTPMDCQGCLGSCIHPLQDGRFRCVAELDEAAILAKVCELLDIPLSLDGRGPG